jgi:regulator of replication initiation timing
MANCEHPSGCGERATKILSVGSLGRVESLCERHVADAVRQLEPNLVPHHLTGIDAPFTGEASLSEQVGVLDTERAKLVAELEDARHENTRLRELFLNRLHAQVDQLARQLQALQDENAKLHTELEEQQLAEPITRVD